MVNAHPPNNLQSFLNLLFTSLVSLNFTFYSQFCRLRVITKYEIKLDIETSVRSYFKI